jgi:hypothetical protein
MAYKFPPALNGFQLPEMRGSQMQSGHESSVTSYLGPFLISVYLIENLNTYLTFFGMTGAFRSTDIELILDSNSASIAKGWLTVGTALNIFLRYHA